MVRLLSIPLALLLLLAAALGWSLSTTEPRADFTFINRGDIITLDVNQMSYLQDIRIAYAMWEGLYTYDGETLDPIPGAASGVKISDDRRVYVFPIRPEARWSNGDRVTSGDFVFAWRRMLESPGEYSYLLYYVRGAEEYLKAYQEYLAQMRTWHAGRVEADRPRPPDFSTVGIESLDDLTLRVTLNDPVAFFLDLAGFPPFLPQHAKSMEPFREIDEATGHVSYDAKFTRPPAVVGNGPFKLVQWDFKRRLRLEKNPHYWDRDNVRSETVEMVVVEDALGQIFRYESGDVDWLAEVPAEIAADLKERGRPDLRNFDGFGTSFLTLNVNPKFNNGQDNPLSDVRVRQALAMAIDRSEIVQTITRMGEKPASTFIPPSIFDGYQSTPGFTYDPARARELLASAGYPGGGTLPGVTYLFRSGAPASRELAQNLAKQWRQNLGLNVPLTALESRIARQRLNEKDYAIAGANWIGDYNDPSTFTDKYLSTSENNDSAWVSAEYDRLCHLATKESDPEKRLRLLETAERILNTEVPIIPLYHLTNQYLFRDNVKGVNTSPRNMTLLKHAEVVR